MYMVLAHMKGSRMEGLTWPSLEFDCKSLNLALLLTSWMTLCGSVTPFAKCEDNSPTLIGFLWIFHKLTCICLSIVLGISDYISEHSVMIAVTIVTEKNSSHFIALAPTSPLILIVAQTWGELHSQRRFWGVGGAVHGGAQVCDERDILNPHLPGLWRDPHF